MSTTIDYAIKPFMREMYKQHRWGVLSILMLHANNLNRCWPSIVGIASDLGISPNQVTKAKNWLIEHGAVQLVPYDKRIGQEELLGPRQLVYQLTGKVTIEGQTVSYLYGSFNVTVDSNVKPPAKKKAKRVNVTAHGNFKITDGDIIDGSNGSISSKDSPINTVDGEQTPPPEPREKEQEAPKPIQTAFLPEITPIEPKPKPPTLFSVIALEVFGLEHVNGDGKKVGGFLQDFLKEILLRQTPEAKAELLRDLIEMYKWWHQTKFDNFGNPLGKPAHIDSICRALREYRQSQRYKDLRAVEAMVNGH